MHVCTKRGAETTAPGTAAHVHARHLSLRVLARRYALACSNLRVRCAQRRCAERTTSTSCDGNVKTGGEAAAAAVMALPTASTVATLRQRQWRRWRQQQQR